jgi:hypothetical protein
MRVSKSFRFKKLNICIGWFKGENFGLFHFDFMAYSPQTNFIIIDFQIAKFAFQILIDLL